MRVEFFFDLADPFSYLAAERVERAFDAVTWSPCTGPTLRGFSHADAQALLRRQAEERASALRMPLVWPERFPADVPAAMRVATLASECGRGAAFVHAAGRLAFCGGFDLEDPDVLAEAAAAAGLAGDACLDAARDTRRDAPARSAGRALVAAGVDRLPALRVGGVLHSGEHRIAEAAAAARYADAN
ncbi:MAG: DsbA family protein [Solirubrobacterales bacterium]|nr:DsbA family protein [Solirubrobacterales bacterium]